MRVLGQCSCSDIMAQTTTETEILKRRRKGEEGKDERERKRGGREGEREREEKGNLRRSVLGAALTQQHSPAA